MAAVAAGEPSDENRRANSYWQSCFGTVAAAVAGTTDAAGQRLGGACHRNAENCIREICRPTCSLDVVVATTVVGVDGAGKRVGCDDAVEDNRCADEMDAVGGDSYTDDGTERLDACSDGHRGAGGASEHRKLAVAKCAEGHWQWDHPCLVDGVAGATVVEPVASEATEAFAALLAAIRVPCQLVEVILKQVSFISNVITFKFIFQCIFIKVRVGKCLPSVSFPFDTTLARYAANVFKYSILAASVLRLYTSLCSGAN